VPLTDLEANPNPAWHISWFVYREDFPPDFTIFDKPLPPSVGATKAEIAAAGKLKKFNHSPPLEALAAQPSQPIKKIYRGFSFADKGFVSLKDDLLTSKGIWCCL
jgi:hypothetical protein